MKKYLLLAFCLCSLALAQAQTFNYTGLEFKQEKVKKKNVYEWEQFVLANYNLGFFDDHKQHSVGVTYGRVKLLGWYTNLTLGTGFHYGYAYTAEERNGSLGKQYTDNGSYDLYPFYTEKSSGNRVSVTAGGIVRIVIPFYVYLGLGYGYQSVTRQLSSGEWVLIDDFSVGHGMGWDVGLQGSIKGFTIAAGYSVLTDYDHGALQEVKISLGYTFKTK